jgi:hypothetical protein
MLSNLNLDIVKVGIAQFGDLADPWRVTFGDHTSSRLRLATHSVDCALPCRIFRYVAAVELDMRLR